VGKTSTLRSITGVLKPHAGKILLAGEDITRLSAEARAAKGIGYVPQGRDIFPQLTVEENLHIGAVALGKKPNGSLERVFSLFPILKEFLPRKGGMLSGGQQQQLAIGRALVLQPKLLILDEPTEGIQPNIVHQIGDIVLRLNKEEGLTVLLVEQKLPFARRVASEFCILDKGRRVASGSIDELTDQIVRDHLSV
jgi:urea transport system ATP-binding protein